MQLLHSFLREQHVEQRGLNELFLRMQPLLQASDVEHKCRSSGHSRNQGVESDSAAEQTKVGYQFHPWALYLTTQAQLGIKVMHAYGSLWYIGGIQVLEHTQARDFTQPKQRELLGKHRTVQVAASGVCYQRVNRKGIHPLAPLHTK